MSNFENKSYIAAQKLINMFSHKDNKEPNCSFIPSERFSMIKMLIDIKSMMNWNFNFKEFQDLICNAPDLQIDVLWNLHVLQILPLDVYLQKLYTQNTYRDFMQTVSNLCLIDCCENDATVFVQTGILSYFIGKAFGGIGEEMEKICTSVVEAFFRDLCSLRKGDMTEGRLATFFSLWKCGLLERKSLREFCIFALQQLIKEPIITITEAIAVQENCKNLDEPFHITPVIEKIVKTLKPDTVVCLLFDVKYGDISNWENYVVILDAFIKTHKEVSVSISKKVLLIGRQVALNSYELFPVAYKRWLMTHFKDCLNMKSAQTFAFFIQVMSYLVPYERNVDIVKIGLERFFNVPQECQCIYNDYITLLKTRIQDLEPHSLPEEIINKLLFLYANTGKLPAYIMEISFMRKHYFLNEFLPVLLTPRVVPTFPDLREKFIEELYRIGKIPSVMFQKYRTACNEEQRKLLAGMTAECFTDEDS
ncbi:fanconi anemia group A [Trichonephila inaurata madagascariensis]|uniref:Fanconi anemia group A n=1 Tax=Trichonephila inaurata madagascariensis TaxID=2747483 RepID=A0A8X7CRG4_9ARAC|nr:fanconi anemia group A [Trichonephila inaurata madagascariensis]